MLGIIAFAAGIVIAVGASLKKGRKKEQLTTEEQRQGIAEQITVIQPIVRDDIRK